MEFEHEGHQKIYEKTADLMTQLFGESAYASPERPNFQVTMGSAYVSLAVIPWGDDDAVVEAFSWVVTGVENTPELHKFLLETNGGTRFGAFAIDAEGDVIFKYAVVGSTLDKEELRACVLAVLHTADEYDDQIVNQFGGVTAGDRR